MRTYVRIWPRPHAACTRAGLAWRGARKRSLTRSGAAAAFVVGFLSFVSSTRSGILLIAVSYDRRISGWLPRPAYVLLTWACAQFYQSGSSLTKWRASAKVHVERVRCVHMRVRVRAHELHAKRACLPAVCSCRQTSQGKFRRVVPRRCRWPQCFPSLGGRPICDCVLCQWLCPCSLRLILEIFAFQTLRVHSLITFSEANYPSVCLPGLPPGCSLASPAFRSCLSRRLCLSVLTLGHVALRHIANAQRHRCVFVWVGGWVVGWMSARLVHACAHSVAHLN